jgi:hypothetical protein
MNDELISLLSNLLFVENYLKADDPLPAPAGDKKKPVRVPKTQNLPSNIFNPNFVVSHVNGISGTVRFDIIRPYIQLLMLPADIRCYF